VVRPRSCRVIYYCDTPALGIRHQLFDRVTYDQYPKYFEFSLKKTNIQSSKKICFGMDFLNTNYFLAFWILQHVYETPKGVGQYSKNIKILL
jgi:hypothetical protein